ncbi:hypothetical protein GCM10022379_25800 [Micromonospora maritima]
MPALVISASVVSGAISEMAPTVVVLPTPKPPAIRIFTGIGGRGAGARRTIGAGSPGAPGGRYGSGGGAGGGGVARPISGAGPP